MKGARDHKKSRVLDKVVSVTADRLTYETDPCHTDRLKSSLNLVSANSVATPCIKPVERDDLLVKQNETYTNSTTIMIRLLLSFVLI